MVRSSKVSALYSLACYMRLFPGLVVKERVLSPQLKYLDEAAYAALSGGDTVINAFAGDFRNDLYKLAVRPLIAGAGSELNDCLKEGEMYLSGVDMYCSYSYDEESVHHFVYDLDFYELTDDYRIVKNPGVDFPLKYENDSIMNDCFCWLSLFAKAIGFNEFYTRYGGVVNDYLASPPFDLQQMRAWLNSNFSRQYDSFELVSSPFSVLDSYYNLPDKKKIIVGCPFLDRAPGDYQFSEKHDIFQSFAFCYLRPLPRFVRYEQEHEYQEFYILLRSALYLVYCYENEEAAFYGQEKQTVEQILGYRQMGVDGKIKFEDFYNEFLNMYLEDPGAGLENVCIEMLDRYEPQLLD